jgi:hypothetical protein
MEFMTDVYEHQMAQGWWFLHEHPHSAASWKLPGIEKMSQRPGVQITVADQCMYGLKTAGEKGQGPKPARKRTRFMTNCPGIAEELKKRCDGSHMHQELLGNNRAGKAAECPEQLCRAICQGLKKEMQPKSLRRLMKVSAKDKVEKGREGDHEEVAVEQAWDDVTGEELDGKEVVKARAKEMGYIHEKNVWERMSRKRAAVLGYKIVKTRWIDINKGDWENPNFRSRFVAKEFNDGAGEGLFASTPSLEALRFLMSELATVDSGSIAPGQNSHGE